MNRRSRGDEGQARHFSRGIYHIHRRLSQNLMPLKPPKLYRTSFHFLRVNLASNQTCLTFAIVNAHSPPSHPKIQLPATEWKTWSEVFVPFWPLIEWYFKCLGTPRWLPYSDVLLAPSDAFFGPLASGKAAWNWQKLAVNLSAQPNFPLPIKQNSTSRVCQMRQNRVSVR